MVSKLNTNVLVRESCNGDRFARDKLFSLIYAELRGLAAGMLPMERLGRTLQPTAVVQKAYLSLTRNDELGSEDRSHFLAIGAEALRNVLVDHARAREAEKGGVDSNATPVGQPSTGSLSWLDCVLDVNDAIDQMAELDERKARVVELKFFGGLTAAEIASVLEVSESSVKKDWRFARAWLSKLLNRRTSG